MPTLMPNGTWRARVRIKGKQETIGYFATEIEAVVAAYNAKQAALKPVDRHTATKQEPRLFREWAEQVMQMKQAKNLAAGTIRNQRRDLKKYAYPAFGDQYIHEITREDIDEWYYNTSDDKPGLPAMPGRTNIYRAVSSVFKYAEDRGYIERTPCRVEDVKTPPKKKPLLKPSDLERLLQCMREDVRVIAMVQWGAALRIGEVLGLDIEDVDLETGEIHVHQQLATREGLVDHTKTKRDRTVKLPGHILEAVRLYRQANPRFGSERAFFTGKDGKRISRRIVERDMDRAREEAGLEWFTSHQLRHMTLTMLAQAGATLQDLMDFGGHSTVQAVMKYQHSDKERRDLLVEKLNDVWAPKKNSAPVKKISERRKSA